MKLKFSIPKLVIAVVLAFLALDLWYALVHLPAQAEKQWQAERQKLIDRGEKLSIADFVLEKVPDERNFFADPLWAEFWDREPATKWGISYHRAKMPEENRQLGILNMPFSDTQRIRLEEEFPEFAPLDVTKKRVTMIRVCWDKAEKSRHAARGAQFVLAACASVEPIISRLRRLEERPDALYPIELADGNLMEQSHAVVILSAAMLLDVQAKALLALGRKDEAFRDVLLIFRLAESLSRDPAYLPAMVEMNANRFGAYAVNCGIKSHSWNDAELQEFDGKLSKLDIPARIAGSLRAERAVVLEAMMPFSDKLGTEFWYLIAGDEKNGAKEAPSAAMFWFYRLYWMPADKVFFARSIQDRAETLDMAGIRGMRPSFFVDPVKEYLGRNPSAEARQARLMSVLSLPLLLGSTSAVAGNQVAVSQTRIAIALERYRMRYGEYPEKLDAVVPELLAKLPLDPVTMEQFLYRRKDAGKFALWSVGWDEIDNEGTPVDKNGAGDWVWGH